MSVNTGTAAGKWPLLRVIRGEAKPEEIAALTTVVLALATPRTTATPVARRSAWADRSTLVRSAPYPGPNAWRAAALPRR